MKATLHPLVSALLAATVLLSACTGPAPTPGLPSSPATTSTPVAPTETALPTVTKTAVPTSVPTIEIEPTPEPEFAQPAGCLSAEDQAGLSTEQMLAYADSLLGFSIPLSELKLPRAWNAAADTNLTLEEGVLAFDVNHVREGYRLQYALNALHVAGFAAYLRHNERDETHILAVSLNQPPPAAWEDYISAYWTGKAPAGDSTLLPGLRLTPCDWMVASGRAPDLEAGTLEAADWSQPDLASAGEAYLAEMTEDAFEVAYKIDWLEGGKTESPVTMCGPLTWSINTDARAFPPGYGEWMQGPKSFWLPSPSLNGRPWSLFPADTYTVMKNEEPLRKFDFSTFPLHSGDIVYTYSGGDGFDHVMVVTDVDEDGRVYAVSNIIRYRPIKWYSIEHIMLYDPGDPLAGYFFNEWATDFVNGRTGHGGFEVLRWNWRAKDINREDASYTVQPGDTLPLVAARWRTPPEEILRANGMEKDAQLSIGQELVIPAMPLH